MYLKPLKCGFFMPTFGNQQKLCLFHNFLINAGCHFFFRFYEKIFIMKFASNKTNCLSNIPERDGETARSKGSSGMDWVSKALAIAIVRYKKTIEELAKG